ncbi:hypothetical protein LC613_03885 [Nostoc sphaeroides CHAB 2801]|nr:hypothetical protein [Nostoc sphaeroides]MCC5627348.1 hypothetical protein [Nostoc sphaeroides CHAB 2801]
MTDALGWRKKFGVLVPSTNTIVEPDFHAISRYGALHPTYPGFMLETRT